MPDLKGWVYRGIAQPFTMVGLTVQGLQPVLEPLGMPYDWHLPPRFDPAISFSRRHPPRSSLDLTKQAEVDDQPHPWISCRWEVKHAGSQVPCLTCWLELITAKWLVHALTLSRACILLQR